MLLDITSVAPSITLGRTCTIDGQIENKPLVVGPAKMINDLDLITLVKGDQGFDRGLVCAEISFPVGDVVLAIVFEEAIEILLLDNSAEEPGKFGAFIGVAFGPMATQGESAQLLEVESCIDMRFELLTQFGR